jgi:hypothetical protein
MKQREHHGMGLDSMDTKLLVVRPSLALALALPIALCALVLSLSSFTRVRKYVPGVTTVAPGFMDGPSTWGERWLGGWDSGA